MVGEEGDWGRLLVVDGRGLKSAHLLIGRWLTRDLSATRRVSKNLGPNQGRNWRLTISARRTKSLGTYIFETNKGNRDRDDAESIYNAEWYSIVRVEVTDNRRLTIRIQDRLPRTSKN